MIKSSIIKVHDSYMNVLIFNPLKNIKLGSVLEKNEKNG